MRRCVLRKRRSARRFNNGVLSCDRRPSGSGGVAMAVSGAVSEGMASDTASTSASRQACVWRRSAKSSSSSGRSGAQCQENAVRCRGGTQRVRVNGVFVEDVNVSPGEIDAFDIETEDCFLTTLFRFCTTFVRESVPRRPGLSSTHGIESWPKASQSRSKSCASHPEQGRCLAWGRG